MDVDSARAAEFAAGRDVEPAGVASAVADYRKPLACLKQLRVPLVRGINTFEDDRAVFAGTLGARNGVYTIGPRDGTFDAPPPISAKRPPVYYFDYSDAGENITFHTGEDGRATNSGHVPKEHVTPRDPPLPAPTRIGGAAGHIHSSDVEHALEREITAFLRTIPAEFPRNRAYLQSRSLPDGKRIDQSLKEALCTCLKSGLSGVVKEVEQVILKVQLKVKDFGSCREDDVSSREQLGPGPLGGGAA